MALANLLAFDEAKSKKQGLSEERVRAVLPAMTGYISYWREYPDMFVEFMAGPTSKFKLFFYQRVKN